MNSMELSEWLAFAMTVAEIDRVFSKKKSAAVVVSDVTWLIRVYKYSMYACSVYNCSL